VTHSEQNAARVAALEKAPLDAWIALSDDETKLIAHGGTYQDVVDQLVKMGDDSSFVMKTPASWDLLSV
jgi:hypothetical protein